METLKKNKYKMVSQNTYKKKIYNSTSVLEIPDYLLKQKIVSIEWVRKNQFIVQQLHYAQQNTKYQCSPLDVGHEIQVAIQYDNMNLDRITISFGTISFSNIDQQTQAKCIFKQSIPAKLQIGSTKIMDSIKILDMIVQVDLINGRLICRKNNIYQFSIDQLISIQPNRNNFSCSLKVDNGLKLWSKIFGRDTIQNEQLLDCHQVPMNFLFSIQKIWIEFLLMVNQAKNQPFQIKKIGKVSNLLSNISTDYLERDSKDKRNPKVSMISKSGQNVNSKRDTVPKPLLKKSSIVYFNNLVQESVGNKSQGDKDSYFSQFQRLIFQDNHLNQLQILDLNNSFLQLQTPAYKQKQQKILHEIEQRKKGKIQQKAQIEDLKKFIKQLEYQKEKLLLQNVNLKNDFSNLVWKQPINNIEKEINKLSELKRKMKCEEVKLKAWMCMHKSKQLYKSKKVQKSQSNRNSLPTSQKSRNNNTSFSIQIQQVSKKARYNRVKRMISQLVAPDSSLNYENTVNMSFQK